MGSVPSEDRRGEAPRRIHSSYKVAHGEGAPVESTITECSGQHFVKLDNDHMILACAAGKCEVPHPRSRTTASESR